MVDMHTANQEDPIMLATLVKNLCFLFGHINSVSISLSHLILLFVNKIIFLNISMDFHVNVLLCLCYLISSLEKLTSYNKSH